MLAAAGPSCRTRDNDAMRWIRLLALALVAALLLAGGAVALLHHWVRSDDFRQRVERQASQAAGVPVTLGALSVQVWPAPGIAVAQLRVATTPPLVLGDVEARPRWRPLLSGQLDVATLVVRDAMLPQPAIAALAAALQKREQPAQRGSAPQPDSPSNVAPLWPRRLLLERVTWSDAQGRPLTFDAQAALGEDGRLESAALDVKAGRFAGARARLGREGGKWPLDIAIGGGQVKGWLQLAPGRSAAARVLSGEFDTAGVEVSALTAPGRTLTGRLQAKTTLQAEFTDPGRLAEVLQSQTRFTVNDATLHGLDLLAAVRSVGLSRGGSTKLDTLSGQVATQGRTVRLTNLVASSGALAATGNVTMAPGGALDGRINVDVAASGQAVGIPLVVGGTAESPHVTLSRGALVGAAIGTALAPGAGTAAGAKLGDKVLRGLFGK